MYIDIDEDLEGWYDIFNVISIYGELLMYRFRMGFLGSFLIISLDLIRIFLGIGINIKYSI